MRLAPHAETFRLGSVPMVGNHVTGGLIGLTPEGLALCDELATRDVAPEDVPESCRELVDHLGRCADLASGCAAELRRKEQALKACVRAYEDARMIGG